MNRQAPGVLSHGLHPLKVDGNAVVDAHTSRPMLLRGVNRSGLEYSSPEGEGSLVKAGITEAEIEAITSTWRANVIRLPFNQEWALSREGYDPEDYRRALDQVVGMAARRGAYTLLDLHWLDHRTPRGMTATGAVNFVPPLPDANSMELWRQLAARYRDEPAVLYDIFNEPHDVLPGDAAPVAGIRPDGTTFPLAGREVTMREWQPWAARLVEAIRSQSERALIFVSGVDWGYDLRGHPLPGIEGLVYSTHIYRLKGGNWDESFGSLSERVPVFAGEWGGGDEDIEWGRALAEYLRTRNIGWAAWSWSDRPRLVEQAGGATAFGELVRNQLWAA